MKPRGSGWKFQKYLSCHHLVYTINGWFILENPTKNGWFGGKNPLFSETFNCHLVDMPRRRRCFTQHVLASQDGFHGPVAPDAGGQDVIDLSDTYIDLMPWMWWWLIYEPFHRGDVVVTELISLESNAKQLFWITRPLKLTASWHSHLNASHQFSEVSTRGFVSCRNWRVSEETLDVRWHLLRFGIWAPKTYLKLKPFLRRYLDV